MSKPFYELVDDLPKSNMTTRVLGALDWVVPGQWRNVVGFEETVRVVTGETDQQLVQQIGERAIHLYNDPSQGYQRAEWLYQTVDSVQGKAGGLALVNLLGQNVGFLSFLSRITPKAETTQAIDLAIKTVVEGVAFCSLNGLPGDSIGDFFASLVDYHDEALMRMAALVCLDGLLPLGPDFLQRATGYLQSLTGPELEQNERFQGLRSVIPGGDTGGQLDFMRRGVAGVSGWMSSFVAERGLTPQAVMARIGGMLGNVEGKLDYVAAFLDMTTNYYEHTGTQTVARTIISRAAGEI
jgi:hypothetical protein